MIFNTKDEFIQLSYTLGAFSALRKTLNSKNLRKTLLIALNCQDYDTLCKAIVAFSDGKIKTADISALIDSYAKENNKSYYDIFVDFMAEIEEAGFFKDKMDPKALKAAAGSPETIMDTEEMLNEAMKKFKGGAVDALINKMLAQESGSLTGATTTKVSEADFTSAE